MRALTSAASILAALLLLGAAYLYAAGRYGMSDSHYRCMGRLEPHGGAAPQAVDVRVQLYRWWMHWFRRGGLVWVEYPSFLKYPTTNLRSFSKLAVSPAGITFGTGLEGAREGRLSYTDMSLNFTTHDGVRFSGSCTNSAPITQEQAPRP